MQKPGNESNEVMILYAPLVSSTAHDSLQISSILTRQAAVQGQGRVQPVATCILGVTLFYMTITLSSYCTVLYY